ncbi:hypothetical protein [Streptomyces sp. SA15]|uniref:hypothetical protein n=1 Tax=Streptomyces sp. SA15 TaxID=934019 RepID=UPI0015CAF5EA|nr:hypothetical protein [Streptomyces sp. SA15]
MFEHRKEAEMRLHSEKLARELALAKQREEESRADEGPATDENETAATTDAEPVG